MGQVCHAFCVRSGFLWDVWLLWQIWYWARIRTITRHRAYSARHTIKYILWNENSHRSSYTMAHHTTSLSSLCRPIWRYWTSKMLSGIFCLEYVFKIKSILSIIFHVICGVVDIQLTNFFYGDFGNTCTLCYYRFKSEVWLICHCLWLSHDTIVCTVCLSIFFLATKWSQFCRQQFQILLKRNFLCFWLQYRWNSFPRA